MIGHRQTIHHFQKQIKHHGYFGVYISSNSCSIQGTHLHLSLENTKYGSVYFNEEYGDDKKEATWQACVNFVEWYNEHKIEIHKRTDI